MNNQANSPFTVLIVEDAGVLRQLLADLLLFLYPDWKVVEAENGKRGLHLAQAIQPDLIITDFNMPIMNGYEMALELRRNPRTSQIPLLLSSSSDMEHPDLIQLRPLCQAMLTKPYTLNALEHTLKNLLAQRSSAAKPPMPYWAATNFPDYAHPHGHLMLGR